MRRRVVVREVVFAVFLLSAFAGCASVAGGSGAGFGSGGDAGVDDPTRDAGTRSERDGEGGLEPEQCAPITEEAIAPPVIAWEGSPPCAKDGFCVVYPSPTGQIPTRIRSTPGADGSTWAVSGDVIYAWRGTTGRIHHVDVDADLLAISPVSDSDVWAVGENERLAHWNGSTWTVTQLDKGSALSGVHARASDDVWAVGNFGVVGHFNGTSWSSVYLPGSPALDDVWAVSANDVWAAEWNGGAWHYDGVSWTKIPSAGTKTFHAVWASSAGDGWLAGDDGLFRGAPSALAAVTVPNANALGGFEGVWGASADDVWVIRTSDAFHLHDGTWTKEQIGSGTHGFAGASWITGRAGSPNDVVAVGDTHVRAWNGAAWKDVFQVSFPAINASWKSPGGDLWFVGANGTILRAAQGGALRAMKTAATKESTTNLRAVWGASDGDVWFAGDHSSLFHLKDGVVCPVPHGAAARIRGLSGSSADDIWAAVDGPASLHYDGVTWQPVTIGAEGYTQAIRAFSKTDAYAVSKLLYHWNGSAWSQVPTAIPDGTMNSLTPVIGGTSSSDVYVTAHVFLDGDKLLHFDGATWSVASSVASNVDAITATSSTDVWMIDWGVHHLEGDPLSEASWKSIASHQRRAISTAIATDSAIWLADTNGAIHRKIR